MSGAGLPIRVVFLAHSLRGRGTERTLIRLLRWLDRSVFEPHLFLVRREGELAKAVPEDVPLVELAPRAVRTIRAAPRLVRHLRRTRPSIAFGVHTSPSRLLCALRGLGCWFRVVCYETDPFRRVEEAKGLYPVRRAVTALLYRRASAIIAASDVVASDLERELRVPRSRIHMIPNPCVDDDLEARATEVVDDPFLGGQERVITAVGGLYQHKRRDLLMRAFALLLREHPARLLLIGSGPEEPGLRRLARELGVEDRVHFLGWQPNPWKYVARSHVFVSPSDSEGFDMATVEAMACGTPVVVSDGPRYEIVRDGVNGLVFRRGDPVALARAMGRVLGDPELAFRLAERARHCVGRLRTSVVVQEVQELMLSLATRREHAD